jgi:hypothetical protein
LPNAEQKRTEMNRQQVQQQQQQSNQAQSTQKMRQERQAQSAAQTQHIQNGPPEKAHANAGPPQGRGPEMRSAQRESVTAPLSPGRGAENRGGPQAAKGGPQGNGGEKGAREGKLKEDKKE